MSNLNLFVDPAIKPYTDIMVYSLDVTTNSEIHGNLLVDGTITGGSFIPGGDVLVSNVNPSVTVNNIGNNANMASLILNGNTVAGVGNTVLSSDTSGNTTLSNAQPGAALLITSLGANGNIQLFPNGAAKVTASNFVAVGAPAVFQSGLTSNTVQAIFNAGFTSNTVAPTFSAGYTSNAVAPVFNAGFTSNTVAPVFNAGFSTVSSRVTGNEVVANLDITHLLVKATPDGVNNFTTASGGTYTPGPSNVPGAVFFYAGAGAVTFQLPSVASLVALYGAVGFNVLTLQNQQLEFQIYNASGQTVTITNGGDATWTFGMSATTHTVPLNTNANVHVVFTGSPVTGATILW